MLRIIVSAILIFYLGSIDAKKSDDAIDGHCEFRNTVNISSGFLDENGDFNHEGTVYVKGYFAEYDYILKNFTQKVITEKHTRGCVCSFKTCVRICCRGDPRNCEQPKSFNVFTKEGNEEPINLSGREYGFLTSIPCDVMYSLSPEDYDDDRWYFLVSENDENLDFLSESLKLLWKLMTKRFRFNNKI